MNTKLKGLNVKATKSSYTLKEQLGKGGFSMVFSTDVPEVVCKAQTLTVPDIVEAFKREKEVLTELIHPNIIRLIDSAEIKQRDFETGFLFLENCSGGSVVNIVERYQTQGSTVPEKIVIQIMIKLFSALELLHSKGITHRDIKMENILINSAGEYKLCDFGSCSRTTIKNIDKNNRVDIEEHVNKSTTPIYRSPEQLDLYSGYEIGTQVDIFAAGCLIFIICFQKPPFESRLSAINKQYFLPEYHPYSPELIAAIEACFTTNPAQRPKANQMLARFEQLKKNLRLHLELNLLTEFELIKEEIARINDKNLKKELSTAETTFLDKIKLIYAQMTTQTEGWMLGFVEDNEVAPDLKYNRSIISKCWEKRYKVAKFYEIMWKYSEEYKSRSLVTLKLLILLHNFLRKGPKEAIYFDGDFSPVRLLIKIYRQWKHNEPVSDNTDIKRNSFIVVLIKSYCLILLMKCKLCYEYSDIIEGNYSLTPYMANSKVTPLRIPFIEECLRFLNDCVFFHTFTQRVSYLTEIQRSIFLSIVDEEYCLVSLLVFILAAFKAAIPYHLEGINVQQLQNKMAVIDLNFREIYLALTVLFQKATRYATLFEQNNFQLNNKVLELLEERTSYKPCQGLFNISNHLNYKLTIHGLKLPLTYHEVIKNPNYLKNEQRPEKSIEIDEYKVGEEEKIEFTHQNLIPEHLGGSVVSPNKKKENEVVLNNEIKSNSATKINKNEPMPASINNYESSLFEFNTEKYASKASAHAFDKILKQETESKPKETKNLNPFESEFNFNTIAAEMQQAKSSSYLSQASPNKNFEKKVSESVSLIDEDHKNENVIDEIHKTINYHTNSVKEIELINFFDDDENKPSAEPSEIKKESNNKSEIKEAPCKSEIKEAPSKMLVGQLFGAKQSTIDLKEFIIDEVKKNAEQYLIDFKTIKFEEKVGFGHSSEVFRGEWRGRQVAIKKINDQMNSANEKEFKREIMTSVKIRHHPNLVTLIGVAQDSKHYFIINEFCNGATLFELLHQSNEHLPWSTRISIAKQIAVGMIFLHTNDPPIIHRDLKSLNVLVSDRYDSKNSDSIHIKIADFGLSRDTTTTVMTGILGTYHWMAPEIFDNQPYSLKADVFSYGIVLWEIAARVPPYQNMHSPQSLMKYVMIENGRPDLSKIPSDCPKKLIDLMVACWDANPSCRPSFSEISVMLSCIK